MLPGPLRYRIPTLIKRSVAAGVLPFNYGARARYQQFLQTWERRGPQTLNEKIQYKMMHDRRPVVRIYSDKVAVRDYISQRLPGLRQPRLLGVYRRSSEVAANVPPGPWVMKGSHAAGMVLICKPGETIPPETIARTAASWLATDYATRHWEWQYHRLPRRVLFEEYLGTPAEPPADYKFFTIHERVRLITVDRGRFGRHTRDLFRPDWTHLPTRKGKTPNSVVPPERPAQLGEMIQVAEQLARGHDFLRVDLYVVDGRIYFGELTHAPAAGTTPFEDQALDLELGQQWTLPARYSDPLPRPAAPATKTGVPARALAEQPQ